MKDTQVERLGPVLAKVPGRAMISSWDSQQKRSCNLFMSFWVNCRNPQKGFGAGESYRFVSFRISPWQKQQHLQ